MIAVELKMQNVKPTVVVWYRPHNASAHSFDTSDAMLFTQSKKYEFPADAFLYN